MIHPARKRLNPSPRGSFMPQEMETQRWTKVLSTVQPVRGFASDRVLKERTLRRNKTSCHQFAANQARLVVGVLAYNLMRLTKEFYLKGEEVIRSIEWLITISRIWVKAHANITVDRGPEGVVRSNVGKGAADPAQRWELESLDHYQKRGDADSRVETHGVAGFWPKAPSFVRSRNNSR